MREERHMHMGMAGNTFRLLRKFAFEVPSELSVAVFIYVYVCFRAAVHVTKPW